MFETIKIINIKRERERETSERIYLKPSLAECNIYINV